MNRKKNLLLITKIIYALEILLSFMIIAGIIISLPDIVKYFYLIVTNNPKDSYYVFQEFLKHILLMVIGMEFILMMIAHSDSAIIYLIMFVIARKMLIKSDTILELMVGVIAILLLFIIKKYLMSNNVEQNVSSGIFSAATPVEVINERFNYDIDDMGFQSLGGLVYYLLRQQGSEIQTGEIIDDQNYIYQVERASNGIIDSVTIQKK
ncbi:MAG: transporter associated domain-containing protein [Tissierellia bacterium]|nr:transporter associated domain-containing protein [Tissierellia bacterium]